ncbi:signal transduction histidine kinase [Williamsia limnetica]|uniref:histidine kinase n=1 Tax=Williamsia limnetica TaxID=882452 RepID=A0A318RG79_WILLI|nr:ATP-binding protein [Williamsia limnetica]PYE12122.1 signal transduction histidine kinase [Williamsia limnetica]
MPKLFSRSSTPRRPGRVSARVRILGWLLLLTVLTLLFVGVLVRTILLENVDTDTNAALTQETEEFGEFARTGIDPATGRKFDNVAELFEVYLSRQVPDEDEILLGVDNARSEFPFYKAEARPPYAVQDDAGLLAGVNASASSWGNTGTPAGEMRWAKVPVTSTNGSSGHLLIGYFTQPARDEVASIMTTAAWAALLALLLIAGVGWVVAGQILAPVRTVRKAAAEISAHDLTQRIPVQRRDDIGELAETFNSMLDRLDDAFATQRQFLDDAGHELRTPITIVQGHLDVMGDDPADRDETLRLVTDELARMTRMVDDLLLLAKARRPDFVRPGPVALADLTSDIYRKVEQLGNRSWSVDSTSTDIVRVDAQRVTQALVQLAHNAVRHTRDGDRIELGSAVDDHVVTFWVADTGSGVSPADAEKIWERFSRGSGYTGEGAGLGLAIVKAIAEAHGGRAILMDKQGAGSTFGIELPR